MWLLGLSFFGLSLEYKKVLMDEFFYLIKYAGFSYSDLLTVPTYERKYFINKLVELNTQK